jgi:hypothetical protein
MPDQDGYPTDEDLQRIRDWPVVFGHEWTALLEFVRSVWWMPDWGIHASTVGPDEAYEGATRWHISTGGWSGNEEIIGALRDNGKPLGFWALCWESSRRGGHYTFIVPQPDAGGEGR